MGRRDKIMQTQAIIIKKQNTNEYDQWVTCYTEEFGKLKTVAKSILKPNSIQALHLDIFNLVEFDLISGRGMPIITGAQVIDPFGGIKNSLAKTAVAYFFIEAVDKMVFENDKDDELWSFLVSFLEELNRNDHNPSQRMTSECSEYRLAPMSLFRQGQIKLLDILGYLPEMSSCKSCDQALSDGNFGAFNHALGGIVCKRCFLSGQGGILISRDDFDLLRSQTERFNTEVSLREISRRETISAPRTIPPERELRGRLGRSVLDGMFEYISGSKFSSLELLNMIRY